MHNCTKNLNQNTPVDPSHSQYALRLLYMYTKFSGPMNSYNERMNILYNTHYL